MSDNFDATEIAFEEATIYNESPLVDEWLDELMAGLDRFRVAHLDNCDECRERDLVGVGQNMAVDRIKAWLWNELRDEALLKVDQQTLISENRVKGYEPVSETDPKLLDPPTSDTSEPLDPPVSDCDHAEAGVIPKASGELEIVEFTYCPKCGEKL